MRIGSFELREPLPQFKEAHVLAVLRPWIDVGSVGTLALSRLERHLQAVELGRLAHPGRYYDFTRYRPRSLFNEGRREYHIPTTTVRYAARETGPDLVFLHLLEPHLYGEEYAEAALQLLEAVGARRYSLVGAMYDLVPHTRPLLVSGVAQGGAGIADLTAARAQVSSYEGPTTITYLINQQAPRLGIETRTFVVHLPQYFQVDEDFTGAARLMEILCRQYDLPERLIDREQGQRQYESLQKLVGQSGEVATLLSRLEERYDQEKDSGQHAPAPPLSPQIEEFLRQLGPRLDDQEGS